MLYAALDAAYQKLDRADDMASKKMGTTLCLILFHRGGLTAMHIGDSRIYPLRPSARKLIYQSKDHSLVYDLYQAGEITYEEIATSPQKNIITRAGLGGLVTTTDKPSVSQVKTAQLLAEAEAHFVTLQFESVLNMIINDLIGTRYKWKLHIWGGIFTFNDEIKRDKELFVSGATFVLPKLASAYDFTIRDTRAAQRYIDSLNIYDDFKTVTQVRQENINEQKSVADTVSTGQVGRPAKDDSEVDNDNTAASKDGGLDTADTREYAMREPVIGKCVVCGAECDGILCDDCREKYDEDNMRW